MDEKIPWAVSDLDPQVPASGKGLNENRLAQAREDAIHWAKEGYATSKWDRCNRCGERYVDPAPDVCPNKRLHGKE